MRKFNVLIVAAVLFVFVFAACGSSEESGTDNSSDTDTDGTAETVTEEDETAEETAQTEETAMEITFESMTVVDNDECSIVITGLDPDDLWGYAVNLELENKSSDKTYMFSLTDGFVNGVEASTSFVEEVAAGKKAVDEVTIYDTDLEENGITEYTDIELSFRVYDSDDWLADDVAEVTVHIYPYGEENAVSYVREAQDTDIVLVDNDYATLIVTGYDPDNLWGYAINVYMVNKTENTVMFSVDDAAVNGYMADPYWASSLAAGKCAFSTISWYDSTLEDIGITDFDTIEEIEFTLSIHNYDDWLEDDYVNETVVLNP